MAQLWGGRFTKETDQLVYNFNASISFDQKFYKQDIRGSIAHVTMLAASGILTDAERDQIIDGLNGILADVENGTLEISSKYEDIHSFVEANLIDRIGDVGTNIDESIQKLNEGQYDLIAMSLSVTDSRKEDVQFSLPLFTTSQVLVQHTSDTLLQSVDDLKGKEIFL